MYCTLFSVKTLLNNSTIWLSRRLTSKNICQATFWKVGLVIRHTGSMRLREEIPQVSILNVIPAIMCDYCV